MRCSTPSPLPPFGCWCRLALGGLRKPSPRRRIILLAPQSESGRASRQKIVRSSSLTSYGRHYASTAYSRHSEGEGRRKSWLA